MQEEKVEETAAMQAQQPDDPSENSPDTPDESTVTTPVSSQGESMDKHLKGTELDPKRQICFDFTKGVCTRGSACKYSHDVALIVKINSQERGICFDFIRGQCNRGPLCRFSHDLSNIAAQQCQSKAKKNAPICYDFVKGMCQRGSECRYSHDLNSIVNSRNTTASGEICYDFVKGRCTRGSGCKYSHDLRMLTNINNLANSILPSALMAASLATNAATAALSPAIQNSLLAAVPRRVSSGELEGANPLLFPNLSQATFLPGATPAFPATTAGLLSPANNVLLAQAALQQAQQLGALSGIEAAQQAYMHQPASPMPGQHMPAGYGSIVKQLQQTRLADPAEKTWAGVPMGQENVENIDPYGHLATPTVKERMRQPNVMHHRFPNYQATSAQQMDAADNGAFCMHSLSPNNYQTKPHPRNTWDAHRTPLADRRMPGLGQEQMGYAYSPPRMDDPLGLCGLSDTSPMGQLSPGTPAHMLSHIQNIWSR